MVQDAVATILQVVVTHHNQAWLEVFQVPLVGQVALVNEIVAVATTVVVEDAVGVVARIDRAAAGTVGTRRRTAGMTVL